jgi:hypothetical protein
VLTRHADLNQIFKGEQEADTASQTTTSSEKSTSVRRKRAQKKSEQAKQMNHAVVQKKGEVLIEKMKNLKVG